MLKWQTPSWQRASVGMATSLRTPASLTGCVMHDQARRPGDAKGLVVGSSMHSTFQDISIYSANGFGMFQAEGGNNTYMCAPLLPPHICRVHVH